MRCNIYAEEMTDRIEIISKEIDGHKFTGLRFYLELPVTLPERTDWAIAGMGNNVRGPFIHRPGDDDSSAVTFWGKRDLRAMLRKALAMLDEHYKKYEKDTSCPGCHGQEQRWCVRWKCGEKGGQLGISAMLIWTGTEVEAVAGAAAATKKDPSTTYWAEQLTCPRCGKTNSSKESEEGEYGIWCVEDHAWCPAYAKPLRGTKEQMLIQLPHWTSGEAADVRPGTFHYEVRRVD